MESNNKLIDELTVYDAEYHITLFCNDKERYVIPLYQRAYAWTDVEIEQLIDDILEHKGDHYYIGSLIVYKRNGEFEVIDGQQRLTTLLLLMLELKLPIKNVLSFACRKKANDTLSKYIEGKDIRDEDLEQNFVQGRKIIAEKLLKLSSDQREILLQNLTHLRLYRIQVPPHTDLNRYFEIMNTRGEQLEQHDILKAMLMNEIQDDAGKNLFAKIWEACSDMTGYVQMHFDVDTRSLLFGEGWNRLQEINYDKFAEQRMTHAEPEFSIDEILAPEFKVQYDDGSTDKNERVRFESVINFPYLLLHVLRVYIYANNILFLEEEKTQGPLDDKKLIHEFDQVLRHGKIGQQQIDKHKFSISFMECLLRCRFLFDKYIIKREYMNESADGEWSLKQLEVSGQEKNKRAYFKKTEFSDCSERDLNEEITMLQSALRVSYTSPKAMHWITELLKWLYDNVDKDTDKKIWVDYIQTTEKVAIDSVKESFFINEDYRHMGVNTPHIVFNYLDFLLWRENRKKYTDFVFEFRNSVEHWYPQHPSGGTFDTWEQEEVDDFGNLCIIQRSENSRFSNMAPAAKKTTFEQMISKGSLKLRLMAERTSGGSDANIRWKQEYKDFGTEMIEKLRAACNIEWPAEPKQA